jgi:hypothetical protein
MFFDRRLVTDAGVLTGSTSDLDPLGLGVYSAYGVAAQPGEQEFLRRPCGPLHLAGELRRRQPRPPHGGRAAQRPPYRRGAPGGVKRGHTQPSAQVRWSGVLWSPRGLLMLGL